MEAGLEVRPDSPVEVQQRREPSHLELPPASVMCCTYFMRSNLFVFVNFTCPMSLVAIIRTKYMPVAAPNARQTAV